jgi:serine protease AprX
MKHRRRIAALFVGVIAVGTTGLANASDPSIATISAPRTPTAGSAASGLAQLLAAHPLTEITTGIATLGSVPTSADVAALSGLGLEVQPMRQLPLAILYGPTAAMKLAVTSGVVHDVYPNEQLQYLDQTSSDAMGAASVRAAGYTGEGVTVAVVDSGCDGTHPDLADHIAHNVIVAGAEYANQPPDPNKSGDGALIVPVDEGPYNNTDNTSGHGTHVAGIIAADGHTDPSHIGVAPDATLVCYSIGSVLFTTAVVSAYDHMLDQPDLWDIDVVNNSWGNSFEQFDPDNPVHVATKAVSDRGVLVVFAAGNSGTEDWEMTLNPFSQAPWVLSVAAEDNDHVRADFSSNGIVYDNSQAVAPSDDGHTVFKGDRIGIYHPDVAAPGVDVSSSCDTTGTVVGPCPPGENASASGTSMASPHVAGAAAVLKGVNPSLTPPDIRKILQVTAQPLAEPTPFWEAGYGRVALDKAVELAKRGDLRKVLDKMQAAASARVLAADPLSVSQQDLWTWVPPPATLGGVPDSQSFTFDVARGTKGLRLVLSHPSPDGATGAINGFVYDLTVKDASGKVVGTATSPTFGYPTVELDFTSGPAPAFGTWTVDVTGTLSVSDPDTLDSDSLLGDHVTLSAVALKS